MGHSRPHGYILEAVKRRIFLLLLILIAGAWVAWKYYPPFRAAALVAVGRGSVCPLDAAVKSDWNLKQQIELKDKILNASLQVQSDPQGYHLWETPKGRFWLPEGSDYVLPYNLAEQERKIYGTGENGPHAGDIVLDCGANIGVTIREELKAGAKQIIGIEPAPENLESLRRNFPEEIKAGRVVIVPKGVWDKDDFLTLRAARRARDAGEVQAPNFNRRLSPARPPTLNPRADSRRATGLPDVLRAVRRGQLCHPAGCVVFPLGSSRPP